MRFELTTSALPRRRSVHWSYRGDVPGARLEPACADFKDRPGCQQPTPEWSRLPVPTRASCLTGAGSQPCATAECAREDLNLHSPCGPRGPQPRASTVPPRAHASLWTVSNRLPAPYEGAALPGELQRHGCPARTRTSIAASRVRRPAISRPGMSTGTGIRTRTGLAAHRGLGPACLPSTTPASV